MQIEYDDQLHDVVHKVNEELKKQGHQLQFVLDDVEQEGFEIYELVKEDLPEGVTEFKMLMEPHEPENKKRGCFECVLQSGPMCIDRNYCVLDKTGKTWRRFREE